MKRKKMQIVELEWIAIADESHKEKPPTHAWRLSVLSDDHLWGGFKIIRNAYAQHTEFVINQNEH